ncbi:MAG: FimB/Mfa2 family fimbrial subunit [Culturomica sp.]|nr:FimB/Mfa2 family fimbrial subunit [Culturomica sp.]
MSVIFIASLSFSCNIYDDGENCPQGINVEMYTQTGCDLERRIPDLKDLTFLIFDKDNLLVSNYNYTSCTGRLTVTASDGWFTVVVWSGLSEEKYNWANRRVGLTTKEDLLFRLKQASANEVVDITGDTVWFGESEPVFLPDPAEYGSVFETVEIGLQEITNRLTVEVEGLENVEDFEIVIESGNTAMNIDGRIANGESARNYASVAPSMPATEGVLTAHFTTLRLESGYNNILIIRSKAGDELFRGDLLGTLLLKNPNLRLDCVHDFVIRFTAKDRCDCGTYIISDITINDWLVHSVEVDL